MNRVFLSDPIPRALEFVGRGLAAFVFAGSALVAESAAPVEAVAVPPEVAAIDAADPIEAAVRVGASFEALAGSEDNAVKLVQGLRDGSEITLTSEIDGQIVQRTFEPATEAQGYGNVFLSLSLAGKDLADAGISEPTPAQLEAALNGGVITVGAGETARTIDFAGVLNLRADGMGWGQIARQMDVNLGEVVSAVRRNPQALERLSLRPEFAVQAGRPERVERMARPERVERVERIARIERPERPVLMERLERPVRIERLERPVRPERPDRPGRP